MIFSYTSFNWEMYTSGHINFYGKKTSEKKRSHKMKGIKWIAKIKHWLLLIQLLKQGDKNVMFD